MDERPRSGSRDIRQVDWDARPMFALDADVTVYWPDVRPCWEDRDG